MRKVALACPPLCLGGLLLLLGACRREAAEENEKLQAAIAGTKAEIASLEKQAAPLSALQPQLEATRQYLSEAGQFDGPNVPAILPEREVISILESDVRGTGATIAATSRGALKGHFRWEGKVKPPGKVWEVARAIVGDRSTEPTRLLELVDQSGLLRGYYPLIPSEDLEEKPLPPVLPDPPPVPRPRSDEGRRLAAELAQLEARRQELVTRTAEVQRTERNLQKLRGRASVVELVGDEMARQRVLLDVAVRLRARKLHVGEESKTAEIFFDDRDDAIAARDSAVLSGAGLTPVRSGDTLSVTFSDPPRLPGFAARKLAFVQKP